MLAFPSMLESAADQAGIKHPEDTDAEYNPEEFVHWHFLCATQLGRPMRAGEHWENAIIIAALDEAKIKTMTMDDCRRIGIC